VTPDDAFLQAIIESPDDDSLRLIYADWIEEHADDGHAAVTFEGEVLGAITWGFTIPDNLTDPIELDPVVFHKEASQRFKDLVAQGNKHFLHKLPKPKLLHGGTAVLP
jgi:uncharacterized protein (TIGR02996 family)